MKRYKYALLFSMAGISSVIGSNVAFAQGQAQSRASQSAPSCHERKLQAASHYYSCLIRESVGEKDSNQCRQQFELEFARAERQEPGCEPLDNLLRTERRVRDHVYELVSGQASPPPCAVVKVDEDRVTCLLTEPAPPQPVTVDSVNLAAIIDQLQSTTDCPECNAINSDTVMWLQAWGGSGGCRDGNACGGYAGFAQTVTSVSDLAAMGIPNLFFYHGGSGTGQGDSGSQGGAATLVALRDLTLTPTVAPNLDEILLLAGGGGGGGGEDRDCVLDYRDAYLGGAGGVAISSFGVAAAAGGAADDSGQAPGGANGIGGYHQGHSGADGIGGKGGPSVKGPSKITRPPQGWVNTGSTPLLFTEGTGGAGQSDTNTCTAGGGSGGGGWGGGAGGFHGNVNTRAQGGGGGGSYSMASTRSDGEAPTEIANNPNQILGFWVGGFVQLVFNPSPN